MSSSLSMGATPGIMPRADGEGFVGTNGLRWGYGYFNVLNALYGIYTTNHIVSSSNYVSYSDNESYILINASDDINYSDISTPNAQSIFKIGGGGTGPGSLFVEDGSDTNYIGGISQIDAQLSIGPNSGSTTTNVLFNKNRANVDHTFWLGSNNASVVFNKDGRIVLDSSDTGGGIEDGIQNNGLWISGVTGADKQIVFAEDGTPSWAIQGGWRNENGEFFYIYNPLSDVNALVISKSGRNGINKHINLPLDHGYFDGDGLDDMHFTGVYEGSRQRAFKITVIETNAIADLFKVETTEDLITYVTNIASGTMTTEGTNLGFGMIGYWTSVTGHNTNDVWWMGGYAQQPFASLSVAPRGFGHFLTQTNMASYADFNHDCYAISTKELGDTVILQTGTNSAFYILLSSKLSDFYVNLKSAATNANMIYEYWNGGTWTRITSANYLKDTTYNLTQSGVISWDKATMTDWTTTNLIVDVYTDEYYAVRGYSTNAITASPIAYSISPHGNMRFAVMGAYGDGFPVFRVEGDGTTYINEHAMTESILKSFTYKFRTTFGNDWTQTLSAGVATKVLFSNETDDAEGLFDSTNSAWYPRDVEIHRLDLNLQLDDLDNAQRFTVYLYENGVNFATVYDFLATDNNQQPFVAVTYVFKPTSVTNRYEIYALKTVANGLLINGPRLNRLFGEKIQ